MARWPEWFRKVGDTAAHPGALDAGKKLLGYLATRRETPGVETLVRRITLDDGTTVEASFIGDQPQVIVYAPDGQETCELYVESGMLDLGPNIAADAGERFNRGTPEFGDQPATLYFGDGVDCVPGAPGLNGRVRVNSVARQLTSECLPKEGRSVESRLRDPVKKQAQAVLPASCWSGLMRRYVQAVYGGTGLDYHAQDGLLYVEGRSVGGYGTSVGLVELAGELHFVFVGSGSVLTSRMRFKSPCAAAVFKLWKSVRDKGADADKILTIALSQAYPDGATTQIGDAGELRFASPYGWQFHESAAEAHAVTFSDSEATLQRMTLSQVNGVVSAAISAVEAAPLAPSAFACVVSAEGERLSVVADTSTSKRLGFDESFDHPIHCYYEDGELVIVRYTVQTPAQVIEMQPGWDCINKNTGEVYEGVASWPAETVEDARNCACHLGLQYGNWAGSGLNRDSRSQNRSYMVIGLSAIKAGMALWSTVRTCDIVVSLHYADNGTEYGSAAGKKWLFQLGWNSLVRTCNLGARFTISSGFSGTEGFGLTFDTDAPAGDRSFATGAHPCTAPIARSLDSVYPSPGYCNYAGPTIFGTSCEEWIQWPPADTTGHTLTAYENGINGSCTTQCAKAHMHTYWGEVIVGPRCYLALPNGCSDAAVAVTLTTAGTAPGDDPFAYGYGFFSSDLCNSLELGDCTGTWMRFCTGWDSAVGDYTHAPHEFKYAEYNSLGLDFYQSMFTAPIDLFIPMEPHRPGRPDNPTWRKRRMHVRWESVVAVGGLAGSESREGQFEEVIDGQEYPWEATEKPVTCPFLHSIVWGAHTKQPIAVESHTGPTSIEKRVLDTPYQLLQDHFNYAARRSLLGACTYWSSALAFGGSLGMDRETITGGYSAVSTPSFVGWA